MIFLSWSAIVDLARQIEEDAGDQGKIDLASSVRLARAILLFQNQMLGGLVRYTEPRDLGASDDAPEPPSSESELEMPP